MTPNESRALARSRVPLFVNALMHLAQLIPLSVVSWGRSTERNRVVGGKLNSLHLVWLAVDVVCDRAEDKGTLVYYARAFGLQAEDEGDVVHLELDLGGLSPFGS